MKQPPAEGQRPEMYFAEGGMPEQVTKRLNSGQFRLQIWYEGPCLCTLS